MVQVKRKCAASGDVGHVEAGAGVAKRRTRHEYYTRSQARRLDDLPSELLLMIFSWLGAPDLYWRVRCVCRRWSQLAVCPSLWSEIRAGDEAHLPTDTLVSWLAISGDRLRKLHLQSRRDVGVVLRRVSSHNKKVESIAIDKCWGSGRAANIPSVPLCLLLSRCKRLTDISLVETRFASCKFFRMLATINYYRIEQERIVRAPDNTAPPPTIQFTGYANWQQLHAFLVTRQNLNSDAANVELLFDGGGGEASAAAPPADGTRALPFHLERIDGDGVLSLLNAVFG